MGEKDFKSLIKEFPEFNESDIVDLRLQFQTFDINQDGIIDFKELYVHPREHFRQSNLLVAGYDRKWGDLAPGQDTTRQRQ